MSLAHYSFNDGKNSNTLSTVGGVGRDGWQHDGVCRRCAGTGHGGLSVVCQGEYDGCHNRLAAYDAATQACGCAALHAEL